MKDVVAAAPEGVSPRSAGFLRLSLSKLEVGLAALAVLVGLAASVKLLNRGVFFDEFFTLAMTEPGQGFGRFYDLLKVDAHPYLYFIIVWIERALGVDAVAAMRSINFVGLGIVAWAIWFALKANALTRQQALALAAVCATSNVFLDAVAELRAYYGVACLTTAAALVWRVVWLRLETRERLTGGLLTAWALTVGVTASLNYFAMAMCGLLAAALMIYAFLRRDMRSVVALAIVSLVAVLPALVNVIIQAPHQPQHFWIATTPKAASEMFILSWRAIILNNLAMFASGAVTLLALIQSRNARDLHRSALVMLAATAAFYALLFAVNMVKPVIIFRYLTAAIGPTLVALVVLAVGRHAPRWTLVGVTVCAILSGLLCIATGKHTRDGWDRSAAEVASRVAACPSTRVYVRSENEVTEELEILANAARASGYDYFRKKLGLPITSLNAGDVVPSGGACPNIFWTEHAFAEKDRGYDAVQVMGYYNVTAAGPASVDYVGDGAIVTLPALK